MPARPDLSGVDALLPNGLTGEALAEHRPAAGRIFSGRFILQYVPMLDEYPVLKSDNVYRNERCRGAVAREASMHHDEVTVGHDDAVFIGQRVRMITGEFEKTLATRSNVRTVLNVLRKPEFLGGCIVAPVKERVECFQHDALVLLLSAHGVSFGLRLVKLH